MKYDHLKALIVDDDATTLFISGEILHSLNIKTVSALTGEDAITKLKDNIFDFILMDINMPGQDGLDAVRWIRDLNTHYYKDIPIFALTSFGTNEHMKETLGAGFNEHLEKPLEAEKLTPLLDKYFWKEV